MAKVQNRRQMQKEATKEHIIETAMMLYLANGFSVPTKVIAKEAGIAHGTIFTHFPTGEDLLMKALERFISDIGMKLHSISAANHQIELLLRAHIEVIEDNEFVYQNLIMEVSSLPDEAKEMLLALNSITAHHFGIAVNNGIADGRLKELPLHIVYNSWIGLLHYYLQNSALFAPDGESVLNRYKDELIRSFMKMIEK